MVRGGHALRRVRLKFGPVKLWCRGDGTGYRARCTLCSWKYTHGDYIWNVKDRARKHISEKHERRKGEDRRKNALN